MFDGLKSRPLQAWLNAEATDRLDFEDDRLVEHGSPAMRHVQPGVSRQKAHT
jgi:hypothetical protein